MAQIQILSLSVSLMSCDGAHTHKVDVSVWGELFLQRFPALGLWEMMCVWAGGSRICCFRSRSWLQGPAFCQRSCFHRKCRLGVTRKCRLGDGFLDNGCWSGCFWDEVISVWRRNVRHRAKKREEGKYGQKLLRLKSFYDRGKMLNNH